MLDLRLPVLGRDIKKKKQHPPQKKRIKTNQKFNSGKDKALSFPSFIGQWIRML